MPAFTAARRVLGLTPGKGGGPYALTLNGQTVTWNGQYITLSKAN